MLDQLKNSLKNAQVISRETYDYFIHPISDGIPYTDPSLLREIACSVLKSVDLDVDRIVTVESMGIPIATTLSLMTDIPMTIIRKRPYGLPGEFALTQSTGYGHGSLYINGLTPGQKILFVDDVISTGGTLLPLLNAFKSLDLTIKSVCCILGRGDGARHIREQTGIDVLVLVHILVNENGVRIVADNEGCDDI